MRPVEDRGFALEAVGRRHHVRMAPTTFRVIYGGVLKSCSYSQSLKLTDTRYRLTANYSSYTLYFTSPGDRFEHQNSVSAALR